jgi:exosortase
MSLMLGAIFAASMGWLYAGTLARLVSQWASSPDASYGIVLAVVSLAVAWKRRRAFTAAIESDAPAWQGAAVLIGGLVLYLAGQLGAEMFFTRVSFVIVVTGGLWFLAGPRAVRVMAAPLVFLLIAIPLPELVVNAMTLPLQLMASRVAETSLAAIGVPVFRDGNVLELPRTTLQVAEACSGLRSIVSLAAIGVLLAWTEPSLPRGAVIVLSSLPVAILMNGFRIAATGVACEAWGPKAASGSWHTFSGWVTFLVSVFVLVQLQRAMSRVFVATTTWTEGPVSV